MVSKIARLLFLLPITLWVVAAQGQVNGNKNLQTRTYNFPSLSSLSITTPAEVSIDASAEKATIEITTDENIFSHLQPQMTDGQVSIQPDTWIEASQLKIIINTPSLEALTTGGYGTYQVNNLRGAAFNLENPVGKVSLQGQVDQLTFRMNTGQLNASQLQAGKVEATIEGFGMAQVNATNFLHAGIWGAGTIVYTEKPARIDRDLSDDGQLLSAEAYQKKLAEARPLPKVNLRLRNNSPERIEALVRGPESNHFSYGFALNARQKRAEEWPVGTKVFQVSKLGLKKLLVTIGEENEGNVVDLF